MSDVSLLLAFGAGLLSFFAPCCLPLVPVYLTYLAGEGVLPASETRTSDHDNAASGLVSGLDWQLAINALCFVCGFTLVFISLGASATLLGQLLLAHRVAVQRFSGALIVMFGLYLAGWLPLPFLERARFLMTVPVTTGQATKSSARSGGERVRAFLLGVAFSAGWQPCVGPVLGAILAYAGVQGSVARGVALLAAYSVGLGLPFLVAALFLAAFRRKLAMFARHTVLLRRLAGFVLILTGLAVFYDFFARLSSLVRFQPIL